MIKLSFSTLGCPDWGWRDIYSTAADLGYDGIEVRGVADEMYAPKIDVFSPDKIEATKSKLAEAGLSIPILTSGAYIIGNPDIAAAEFEIKDYAMLAKKLSTPLVRILGEATPDPEVSCPDIDEAAARYKSLCRFAAEYGVTLCIETNGCFGDTAALRRFMEKTDEPNAGVIWDIHHPYRFFGESPDKTLENIGGYIRHVHFKDSVRGSNGKITYMLTGYGDMPVERCVRLLRDRNFDGFISYEWVKRWSRELAEPGVAFYQYIDVMRDYLNK
jgi:fatty-acyl-CoA synthase